MNENFGVDIFLRGVRDDPVWIVVAAYGNRRNRGIGDWIAEHERSILGFLRIICVIGGGEINTGATFQGGEERRRYAHPHPLELLVWPAIHVIVHSLWIDFDGEIKRWEDFGFWVVKILGKGIRNGNLSLDLKIRHQTANGYIGDGNSVFFLKLVNHI